MARRARVKHLSGPRLASGGYYSHVAKPGKRRAKKAALKRARASRGPKMSVGQVKTYETKKNNKKGTRYVVTVRRIK